MNKTSKKKKTFSKLMIRKSLSLLLFGFLFYQTGLHAQEPDPSQAEIQKQAAIEQARNFLKMDNTTAKEYASKLSPVEARALTTQIMNLKRKTNPDLDRLFVLIQHLDNIRASELAQARLDKLLLVLSLVLVLFSLYLLFLLIDQRRTLQKMQQLVENSNSTSNQKQADTEVFRG